MSILLNKTAIKPKDFPYYEFDLINEVTEENSNDFIIQGKIYNKQNKYVKNANIQSYGLSSIINKEQKQSLFETIYSNNFFWIDTKKFLGKILKQGYSYLIIEGDIYNKYPFDVNDINYNKENLYIKDDKINHILEVKKIAISTDIAYPNDTMITFVDTNIINELNPEYVDLVGSNISIANLVYNNNKEYSLTMINEDKFNFSLNVNSVNLIIENEVFKEKYYVDIEKEKKNLVSPDYYDYYFGTFSNVKTIEDENFIKTITFNVANGVCLKTWKKNTDSIDFFNIVALSKAIGTRMTISENSVNEKVVTCVSSRVGSDLGINTAPTLIRIIKFNMDNLLCAKNEYYDINYLFLADINKISYILQVKENNYNNDVYHFNMFCSTGNNHPDNNLFNEFEINVETNTLINKIDLTPSIYNLAYNITVLSIFDHNKVNPCIFLKYQETVATDIELSVYSISNQSTAILNATFHTYFSDLDITYVQNTVSYIYNDNYYLFISYVDILEPINKLKYILLQTDLNFNIINITKEAVQYNTNWMTYTEIIADNNGVYLGSINSSYSRITFKKFDNSLNLLNTIQKSHSYLIVQNKVSFRKYSDTELTADVSDYNKIIKIDLPTFTFI